MGEHVTTTLSGPADVSSAPARRRDKVVPTGRRRRFGTDVIIVSKTDLRGHITYANDVFIRVCGYTEDELLGSVSLRRFSRDRRAELGYWLGADAWGSGYATEAATALVDFGFREMGLARIYAQVLAGNDASCRVLEKLGMLSEGIRRRHIRKGKTLHDVVLYGILRDEWSR